MYCRSDACAGPARCERRCEKASLRSMRDVPPRGRRRAPGEPAYAMLTSSRAGFAVPSHAIAKPEFIAGGRLSALVFSAVLVLETCVPGGNVAATTIAVKRATDFVVVAADSRVTGEDGRPRWRDKCKIMLLDDEGFFASVGVVSARGGGEAGEIRFSADQVARHQYGASSDLRRVADGWAERWKQGSTRNSFRGNGRL
jgi:hypothetical protein